MMRPSAGQDEMMDVTLLLSSLASWFWGKQEQCRNLRTEDGLIGPRHLLRRSACALVGSERKKRKNSVQQTLYELHVFVPCP